MPKVDRQLIESNLTSIIDEIKTKRKITTAVKKKLSTHGVSVGDVEYILSGRTPVTEVSMSVLGLLLEGIHSETGIDTANPEHYFTQQEIKNFKVFEVAEEDRVELPYTFSNVAYVKEGNYSTTITAQEIKKMFDGNILVYNFETQREAKVERDKNDNIVLKPKTNPKSVNEIADLLKSGELETTTITFNALAGTSDSGEELVYDHKNRTLTVTKGTQINILDGYHRISAIVKALTEDPTLDGVFDLKILNYSVKRALKYFNQINRTNPISESRLKETNIGNMATVAAEELKDKCEYLYGKVSSGDKLYTSADQLVSSNVLIDAIDEHFNPTDRLSARETGAYLADFFTELFESYPDAFIRNIGETRKHSIINANQMFDGYVLLAKKMQDSNIPTSKVKTILDSVDFERTNPQWKELGILDESNNISSNPKRKIRQFISQLNMGEVEASV